MQKKLNRLNNLVKNSNYLSRSLKYLGHMFCLFWPVCIETLQLLSVCFWHYDFCPVQWCKYILVFISLYKYELHIKILEHKEVWTNVSLNFTITDNDILQWQTILVSLFILQSLCKLSLKWSCGEICLN